MSQRFTAAEPGSSAAGSSSEAASSSAAGSSSFTVFNPSQLDEVQTEGGLTWTCANCTYENTEVEGQYLGLRACSACEEPRERPAFSHIEERVAAMRRRLSSL